MEISVPLRGLWFLSSRGRQIRLIDCRNFRPLAGIMVLILSSYDKPFLHGAISVPLRGLWFLSKRGNLLWQQHWQISVPLRGLWFLSAPFIDGFMKPLKWHFAGRIIYFHHFSSFARKWFSKNRLGLNFKAAGWNRPACIFKKQVRHINNVCLTNSYYNTSS